MEFEILKYMVILLIGIIVGVVLGDFDNKR